MDYSKNPELNEAIMKYYALLRMTFESHIYKIFETIDSQIYRFILAGPPPIIKKQKKADAAFINFVCPNCKSRYQIQANLDKSVPLKHGSIPYPIDNDVFLCKNCNRETNLQPIRRQLEAQSGKKVEK